MRDPAIDLGRSDLRVDVEGAGIRLDEHDGVAAQHARFGAQKFMRNLDILLREATGLAVLTREDLLGAAACGSGEATDLTSVPRQHQLPEAPGSAKR